MVLANINNIPVSIVLTFSFIGGIVVAVRVATNGLYRTDKTAVKAVGVNDESRTVIDIVLHLEADPE